MTRTNRRRSLAGSSVLILGTCLVLVGSRAGRGHAQNPPSLPPPDAHALWEYMTADGNFFRDWRTFPGTGDVIKVSEDPHGDWVSVHVNDIAYESLTRSPNSAARFEMQPGSILVKENFPGTSPPVKSSLLSLTVMYKPPGESEWFWVMFNPVPDGTVHTISGNEGWYKEDSDRWKQYLGQRQAGSPTFCTDCHSKARNPGTRAWGDFIWKLSAFE